MEAVLLAWGLGIITVFTTSIILVIFWLVRMYQDQRDELIALEEKIYLSMEDIDRDHLMKKDSLTKQIDELNTAITELNQFQNQQLEQKSKLIYAAFERLEIEVNRLVRSY
jgi:TolA-binding protein